MTDLITFLRARYDEDEWKARAVKDAAAKRTHYRASLTASAEFDLADLDSKRRILDLHRPAPCADGPDIVVCATCGPHGDNPAAWGSMALDWWPCDTAKLLALPYADHEGYRAEWRP